MSQHRSFFVSQLGDGGKSAFNPLRMHGGHRGLEVTELLLLLAVEPALTTRLLGRFVVAAVLIRHGAKSGERGRLTADRKRPTWKRKWAGLLKLVSDVTNESSAQV